MEIKDKPGYYGILPAHVRYDKELPPMARIMYSEITALSNSNGFCSAGNDYFAELYGVSVVTVSRWISKLGKRGHIMIDADPVTGHERKLYPLNKNVIPHNKNVKAPIQKDQGPLNKNVKHNITSIILQDNTRESAREEKQEEPEIIQPLNADPNPSKKVARNKVSTDYHALAKKAQQMERNHLEGLRDEDLEIINSKTPESWIEAVEMCCEYFKTDLGIQELKMQCRSAGVEFEKVDIRQVLTQFFGKKKSQPLVWMNPMNYTASLTAWIKTEYSAKPRFAGKSNNQQKPNALKIINNDKYAQYEAEWRAEQERRKASA